MNCPRTGKKCFEISCGWNRYGFCEEVKKEDPVAALIEYLETLKKREEEMNRLHPSAYHSGKMAAYHEACEAVKKAFKEP